MSQVFRLHKSNRLFDNGWQESSVISKENLDEIATNESVSISQKAATSIPTPFARFYAVETAFQRVNQLGLNGDTLYHHLVSDVLDLLDLIFSNNPDIQIVEWDPHVELNRNDVSKLLINALKSELEVSKLIDISPSSHEKIFLIFYKNQLLGGTAKGTLVYTSPNIDKSEINVRGSSATRLFTKEARSLIHTNRSDSFCEYLWVLVNQNRNAYFSPAFVAYIDNALGSKFNANRKTLDSLDLDEFQFQNKSIFVGGIALRCVKQQTQEEGILNSSYLLKVPIANLPTEFDGKPPMIFYNGIDKVGHYINAEFDINTAIYPPNGITYTERTLPGYPNIKYPWVTPQDFFNDYLFISSKEINSQEFYTFSNEKYVFYPFTKLFFQFFGIAKLKDVKINKIGEKYIIGFDVEVKGTPNWNRLTLTKEYNSDNIIKFGQFFNQKHPLSMAFTPKPSLRYSDDNKQFILYKYLTKDSAESNSVSVKPVNLTSIKNVELKWHSGVRRKVVGEAILKTLEINSDFQAIEIKFDNKGGAIGYLIPKFNEVPTFRANRAKFAIDFGTSNTHVSFLENEDSEPVTFQFVEKQSDDSYSYLRFCFAYNDESFDDEWRYFPLHDSKTDLQFPLVTNIFKSNNASRDQLLFGHANLGYSYSEVPKNIRIDKDEQFVTNIKWLSNQEGYLIEIYFQHLFLQIKQFCLEKQLRISDVEIIITLTKGMSKRSRDNFLSHVNSAFNSIFPGNIKPKKNDEMYESIAPYAYLQQKLKISEYIDSVINFDIGGGTADIVYFDPRNKTIYDTGVHFAANLIWENKPFVSAVEQLSIDENFKTIYDLFEKSKESKPEDTFNLFFSKLEINKYRNYEISNLFAHSKIRLVFFIHFTALLYHTYKWMKSNNLPLPKVVSFTGKGSKYLDFILSSDRSKKEFVLSFFKLFENSAEIRSVAINERPKMLTAEGALYAAVKQFTFLTNDNIKTSYWSGININGNTDIKTLNESTFMLEAKTVFKEYIDALFEQKFIGLLNKEYEINLSPDDITKVKEEMLYSATYAAEEYFVRIQEDEMIYTINDIYSLKDENRGVFLYMAYKCLKNVSELLIQKNSL